MHSFLKQSTAAQSRSIGPFVDDTDFKTAETGLTIANTDIKLMINGAASANKNSGGGTHRANGVYGLTFDATDTATVGEIFVSVVVAGALPVFATFVVVEEEVYDDLFAASAVGYLKPTTAGRDLDVSAGGEAGLDWANVGSPTTSLALTGTTIAVTQKVDVDTIKTNPVVNAGTITFPTTATLASTTNITAGTIATVTNLTNAPGAGDFTATMKTSIGTAVAASAVASVTGNVGGNVTGSVGSVVGAVGSVTGAVGSVTGAVGSVTGNVGGNVVGTVASVVGAVGSVTGLTASNLDATISSRASPAQILTTTLTESYAADGAAGTLSQLVFGMQAFLQERSVTGTTLTVKKLDGSTTAMTFTLSDATSPVSVTRAS